jgi:hypothetical protein
MSGLNFQSGGLLLRRVAAQTARQTAAGFGHQGCEEAVSDR